MAISEGLETGMLILFSVGWYWSIWRMLRVRTAVGKSARFVACVIAGYGFGIAAKLAEVAEGAPLSPVIWVYGWNLVVTAVDLGMVLHFNRRGKAPLQSA